MNCPLLLKTSNSLPKGREFFPAQICKFGYIGFGEAKSLHGQLVINEREWETRRIYWVRIPSWIWVELLYFGVKCTELRCFMEAIDKVTHKQDEKNHLPSVDRPVTSGELCRRMSKEVSSGIVFCRFPTSCTSMLGDLLRLVVVEGTTKFMKRQQGTPTKLRTHHQRESWRDSIHGNYLDL